MRTRSPRPVVVLVSLLLGLAGVAITPERASARREDTYNYPFTRVWTSAVRLLRVDFECPITEKDRDEGYFFFEYTDHNRKYPGSVELVPVKEHGIDSVRVVVQVPAMPTYVESMMLDRLGRKLKEDFGEPQAPAPEPPKPAAPPPGKSAPQAPGAAPGVRPATAKPTDKPTS